MSGPAIARGTIVIRGNRIQAVGASVSAPSGARTIDARGASVYPGFIDAGTNLGIREPGVSGMDDVSEMLDFSPRASHDDQVDALVGAFDALASGGTAGTHVLPNTRPSILGVASNRGRSGPW